MKKHGSVLHLMLRASLYPVLSAAVAVPVIEFPSFLQSFHRSSDWHLDWLMDARNLPFYFVLIIVIMSRNLSMTGSQQMGSHCGYTLRRLSISEKAVFCWQTAAVFLSYLVLYAVQALTLLLCAGVFLRTASPEMLAYSAPSLYGAASASCFFRAMMPGTDWCLWLCTLILLWTLAASTAFTPFIMRRGRKFPMYLPAVFLLYFHISLKNRMVDSNIFIMVLSIFLLLYMLYQVWEYGDEDEEIYE